MTHPSPPPPKAQPNWPEEDLETLPGLVKLLDPPVTISQLRHWEERRKTTSFPPRRKMIGRYPFFSIKEVTDWYSLWRKATRNLHAHGGGKRLNGGGR